MEDVQKLDESFAKKERKSTGNAKKASGSSFRNFEERKDDYSDLIRQYYET